MTTLAAQQEDLQNHHLRVLQDAARVRHDLEEKLTQAEASLAQLRAHGGRDD